MSTTEVVQQIINALALGSIYALLALGLAIVFSVMGVINFAHGELVTIAGYVMFVLVEHGVSWYAIMPAAVLASALSAIAMERIAFRPVRGASVTTMLITSFAVASVLQGCFLVFISPRPEPVPSPDWMNENLQIGGLQIQNVQIATAGVTAIALILLVNYFKRFSSGIAMRAAAEDFEITRLMGARANRLFPAAFALSGALAGIAAIFWVGRLGSVEPTLGLNPVLKAFIACVIGGFGSLPGAVVGGFVLGALEVAFAAFLPSSVLDFQTAFVLACVVGLFLLRPQGLVPAATVERA